MSNRFILLHFFLVHFTQFCYISLSILTWSSATEACLLSSSLAHTCRAWSTLAAQIQHRVAACARPPLDSRRARASHKPWNSSKLLWLHSTASVSFHWSNGRSFTSPADRDRCCCFLTVTQTHQVAGLTMPRLATGCCACLSAPHNYSTKYMDTCINRMALTAEAAAAVVK